jgi:twitching motility protein PilJ
MNASQEKSRVPLFNRNAQASDLATFGSGSSPNGSKTRRGLLVSQRMLLLVLLLALPILVFTGLLLNSQQQQIDFAQSERDGAEYVDQLGVLLQRLTEDRILTSERRMGFSSSKTKQAKTAEINTIFTAIDDLEARFGNKYETNQSYQALKNQWIELNKKISDSTIQQNEINYDELIEDRWFSMLDVVLNKSNLILDPTLNGYFIQDLVANKLARVTYLLGELSSRSNIALLTKNIDSLTRQDLIGVIALLRSEMANSEQVALILDGKKEVIDGFYKPIQLNNSSIELQIRNIIMLKIINNTSKITYPSEKFVNLMTELLNNYYKDYNDAAKKLKKLLDSRISSLQNVQRLIFLGLALLIPLIALITFLIIRSITRPLAEMSVVAQKFGLGDLSQDMPVRSRDEIGRLGSVFNDSIKQLRGLLGQQEQERVKNLALQQNIGEFLNVAMDISGGDLTKKGRVTEDALGNVVDAINLMTEEIGYLLKDVQSASSKVNLGATSLSQVSTGIAFEAQEQSKISTSAQAQTLEVTTNMRQMSEAAEVAAQTAQEALQAGQAGQKAVADTVAGIQNIRREVQNISRGMKSLANRSLEISEIIETISGIAAQTNLLALNATVEASSAGEAGARFATVADEVRKLSEEAERATSRVTSLVRAIQTETQAAVVGVEAGAKEVELGFEIASGAGARLQEISVLTAQSANFAQTIASSTRNQLDQMGDVAKAVQSMAGTASQTEQDSKQGQDSAQALVQLSERLSQSLSRFQLPS